MASESTFNDKGPFLLAFTITLTSVTVLIFLQRIYTRGGLLRSFRVDDWLMTLATLCTIGVLVSYVLMVDLGFGTNGWTTDFGANSNIDLWGWVSYILFISGVSFVKLSVLYFFSRIFDRKSSQYTLYAFIFLLFTTSLFWLGSVLLRCVPVTSVWDAMNKPNCMPHSDYQTIEVINNAINVSTDITLLTIILIFLFDRSISITNRILTFLVFCIASAACAAAIIRTKLLFANQSGDHQKNHDMFSAILSVVELTAGISAASLPILKPLWITIFRFFLKRRTPTIKSPILSRQTSFHSASSKRTEFYRPGTAYFPSAPFRFHDEISNLDFDIETATPRTRPPTLRTQSSHSRQPSEWSHFSSLTYYASPMDSAQSDIDVEIPAAASKRMAKGVSVGELQEMVKRLGLGKVDGTCLSFGMAITETYGLPDVEALGTEMTDMGQLSEDICPRTSIDSDKSDTKEGIVTQ